MSSSNQSAAIARLSAFVASYTDMRGLDPEYVYSIHAGPDGGRSENVRISDLRTLLAIATPTPTPLPAAPDWRASCADLLAQCDAGEMAPVEALEDIRAALATPPAVDDDERLRLVTAGVYSGYTAGHDATVEGHYGDPEEVAADMAPVVLAEAGPAPPAATRKAGPLPQAGAEISTEEWYALKEQLWDQFETVGHQGERFMWFASFDAALDKARAALARWGGAAVPVPVSERLPGPEDCDAEDRCWLCGKVEGDWRLISVVNPGVPHLKYCFSHWLPHWALPVPAAAAGEVES